MDEQPNKDIVSSSSVKIDGAVQGLVQGEHNIVTISYGHSNQASLPPADQNRQRFLAYLRTRYHDVLEQSLQGAALIALGLHTRPEAIAHPAHLVFRHLNQIEQVLPPGTSILQVYDQASGDLLILGEPGAGKSTLLLHLAQSLRTRAEHDNQYPLSVIFNLSSWAQKRRPLDEWLVEELLLSYQVPRKVGKLWVVAGQILPLLDGLDEVAEPARGPCIDAINTYRRDHLVPLVVCSRMTEYVSQEQRLVLQNAVVAQPLDQEQIDDYLETAGPALAAVRSILEKKQVLRELAASPLMLNVLTLAYRDSSVHALPTSGLVEEQQRQIFASYIERMLHTNETIQRTSSQRMQSQLTWLARQMQRHSQTVFYMEQLQPSWLSDSRMLQTYDWWAIRLPSILTGILVSLAIPLSSLLFFLSLPVFLSLLAWPKLVSYLFLGGLLGEFLSRRNAIRQSLVSGRKGWDTLWRYLLAGLLTGIFTGLLFGFLLGLEYGQNAGLLAGLAFGAWSVLLQTLLGKSYIRLEARNKLLIGLPSGLTVGLIPGSLQPHFLEERGRSDMGITCFFMLLLHV